MEKIPVYKRELPYRVYRCSTNDKIQSQARCRYAWYGRSRDHLYSEQKLCQGLPLSLEKIKCGNLTAIHSHLTLFKTLLALGSYHLFQVDLSIPRITILDRLYLSNISC